jgi:hypothetical protein
MKTTPKITVTRFEQLKSGDLFIWLDEDERCIALKAENPEMNGEKLIVPLGPKFPREVGGPRLLKWAATTVISFGQNYEIELPTAPECWLPTHPKQAQNCLLIAEDAIFFRANSSPRPDEFEPCYIRATNGVVNFTRPPGIFAFVVGWKIVTTISVPVSKVILENK